MPTKMWWFALVEAGFIVVIGASMGGSIGPAYRIVRAVLIARAV
jgi:hypothetical protein